MGTTDGTDGTDKSDSARKGEAGESNSLLWECGSLSVPSVPPAPGQGSGRSAAVPTRSRSVPGRSAEAVAEAAGDDRAETAESVSRRPATNRQWVEAALDELDLAPDPEATGPVWRWIVERGGAVAHPTVRETLSRLREQDGPLLPGPGCRIPGTLESRGAALPDPWADAPVEAQPPAADPPSPAPAPRRPGAPAWLPQLLELRALAPDAAPFTLSLRLQTEHGVRVSGREAKEALALHDRQHGANGHRPYPSVRVTTRRGRPSICRSPWGCCWPRASFRPSE